MILVLIKKLLAKFFLLDNYCKICGYKAEVFHVDNELWNEITNHSTKELCLECFGKLAKQNFIQLKITKLY